MEKILSIIIPTYNMEKYLRHCLDSLIIKENMDKLEVLVINDGSKDTSSAIAHEYQDKYPQTFRVIDKENGNYGSCINRGLNEATGKYIKVLDADDSFDNKTFNSYISTIMNIDVDLIVNGGSYVYPDGEKQKDFFWVLPCNKKLDFQSSIDGIIESSPSMHTYTYRTELLRNIGYQQTEGVSYTDQEWIFLPMYNVKTIYATKTNLYQYLIGREGQTIDPKVVVKSFGQKIIVYKKLLDSLATVNRQNEVGIRYLSSRLRVCLTELYSYYLIKFHDKLSIKDLIEFDSYYKYRCPEFYSLIDDLIISKKYPNHYVKNWRKKANKEVLPLALRMYHYYLSHNRN